MNLYLREGSFGRKVLIKGSSIFLKRLLELLGALPRLVIRLATPIRADKIMFIAQDNIYTCGVAPYMRVDMDVINGNMNILKLK